MDQAVLALALVAGAVAAFNPCGFALLPAYLGLLVADDAPGGRPAALRRAVRFAAGMTVGFVAVFGLAAAVLAPLALSFERYLPIVTVVIGIVLVGLGGWLLTGGSWRSPVWPGTDRPRPRGGGRRSATASRSRWRRCRARSRRSWR